ncbi:hypothetical protein TNCV_2192081 [Trichonephila clavipes]|nr:hypothetical protein TNCV_2192081 [Trichonephila clavipes]
MKGIRCDMNLSDTKSKVERYPGISGYEEEREDMLSRIVSGNSTWVPHITLNQNNSRWNGDAHPLPLRSNPNRRCQSARL